MTYPHKGRRMGGFTLIEVLLVLVILVVLASFAFMTIGPIRRQANIRAAKAQIGMFRTPLETYQLDLGSYPTNAQGLQALRTPPGDLSDTTKWNGPYLGSDVPPDPWVNRYQYISPGSHNPDSYDVWTVSPDGKEIGNWGTP